MQEHRKKRKRITWRFERSEPFVRANDEGLTLETSVTIVFLTPLHTTARVSYPAFFAPAHVILQFATFNFSVIISS